MDQPDQPADAPNSVSAERSDGNGAAEEPSALGEPSAVSAAALAAEIAELKAQLATVSDQAEARLAAWDDIPWHDLAFPSVRWALHHYREYRSGAPFAARSNPPGELGNL